MIERRSFLKTLMAVACVPLTVFAGTKRNVESFDVAFVIVTDKPEMNAASLYATGCLPARWAPHPKNPLAKAQSIVLMRDPTDELKWRVGVHYSTETRYP